MAGGVRRGVYHLGARVQLLPGPGKGDAGKFHPRALALQDAHGVQAGGVRAEGAGHPLDGAARGDLGAFGVEVVHIFGPVFNGRIPHTGILTDVDFHAAGVQVGNVVFGGRAALDKMQVGALFHDDQRMLKLPGARRIEPEIRLQRNFNVYARRDIHKAAAAPHRAVQRRKLVVCGGNQLHKMGTNQLGIFALQGAFHIGVDYALRGDLGADVVVDDLGIILRTHARQPRALCLRDAKALKGVFDIGGHIAPFALHGGVGAHIRHDVAHIQPADVRSPVLHGGAVVDLQGLQAEIPHPGGVVLFGRNLRYDLRRQTGADLKRGVGGVFNVVDAAVHGGNVGFFGFVSPHFAASPFTEAKPSCKISVTSAPLPVRTMRALSRTWT